MIEFLAFIVIIFIIFSIICFFIGILNPAVFKGIFKKNIGRIKTSSIFAGITFVLIIFLVALAVISPTTSTQVQQKNKHIVSAKQPSTVKPTSLSTIIQSTIQPSTAMIKKATPTPDPNYLCDNDHNNGMDFDPCLRLKYSLKATVKADNVNLYVTNPTDTNWTGCNVQQDSGNYMMNLYDNFDVSARTTTTVAWGRLVDGNGNRFDYTQTQPGPIDISCIFPDHNIHESQFQGF